MPQTTCTLDGYLFKYNAPQQSNPSPISIQHTTTTGGGFDTIWHDTNNSNVPYFKTDFVITLKWSVMDSAFYAALLAKVYQATVVTFIDWDGISHQVLPLCIPYESIIKAGNDAYLNVTLYLRVRG